MSPQYDDRYREREGRLGPSQGEIESRARANAEIAARRELIAERETVAQRKAREREQLQAAARQLDQATRKHLAEALPLYRARAAAGTAAVKALIAFVEAEWRCRAATDPVQQAWFNGRRQLSFVSEPEELFGLRVAAGLPRLHQEVGAAGPDSQAGMVARVLLEMVSSGYVNSSGVILPGGQAVTIGRGG